MFCSRSTNAANPSPTNPAKAARSVRTPNASSDKLMAKSKSKSTNVKLVVNPKKMTSEVKVNQKKKKC